jgi:hypothetical protein
VCFDRDLFIIITHAKRTMEVADALYGVTMQEPGVSRLVAGRLKQASAPPTSPAHAAHRKRPAGVERGKGAAWAPLPLRGAGRYSSTTPLVGSGLRVMRPIRTQVESWWFGCAASLRVLREVQ